MRTTVSPSFRERVLEAGRDEHERARAGDDDLVLDGEGQLALEDVEGVVLGLVRVDRRAAAVRLDLDHGEVEARRVGAARKELDVPDAVALARPDDDGLHPASRLSVPVSASSASWMSSAELNSAGL